MQDFFERTVFRSESGESEFHPHTFTMHFAWPYLDRPFGSVSLHEILHWIQFICYTFGGFQNALIHMRNENAKNILILYSRGKHEYQKYQFRFSMPGSIETRKAFFNPTFDHIDMIPDIFAQQHAWRDAFICENLFLQMSKYYEAGKGYKGVSSVHEALQPELLIPRTLICIDNWATRTLDYRSIETRDILAITDLANHPKLSNFGQAIHAGIELDTKDILEGMAVAFEMYMLHSDRMENHAELRLEEIANTSYARAIEIFLEIMGFPVRYNNDGEIAETALSVAKMAMMFLAIAEMSLNPPLPPFGIFNKLELDWNKIYPPLRFIELCHIAKLVLRVNGYVLDPVLSNWIFDWIAKVESLYLSQGGGFSYLIKYRDGFLPDEKSVPFLTLVAEENPIMREILDFKGMNTTGMAEKFPEVLGGCSGLELYALLRNGHILFMNWFGILRPFLIPLKHFIPFKGERNHDELFRPPLVVFKDGHTDYGWSENFAQYLIDFNLYRYPLHDIILRREPRLYLPDSPLIDDERRKMHWDHLQKTFSSIF